MNESKISIVIPVFNSAVTLQELCSRIHKTMLESGNDYEMILVDDGSSDTSWKELNKIKASSAYSMTAIKLAKNFGQHNAILCGLNFCKGNMIITMDDDLQHPPEEIPKLIRTFDSTDADIVYGIPMDKKHSSVRNAGSYFLRVTSDHNSGQNQGGSSFRLIKSWLAKKLLENHSHNFLYIDAVLGWYTGKIAGIDVEHHPRKAGRSGYTVKALIFTYIDILINYSAGPLKFLTYGGLFMSVLSFITGLRFIYKKIVYDVPLGYTSLIVSILFSTSLILFCLGIIGQYLYKLYQLQNKRPPYSIETQL